MSVIRLAFRTIIILAACLLPACATSGDRAGGGVATPVGDWVLTAIRGEPLEQVMPEGARTPTLSITADGRVSGRAPINQYSGAVDPDTWTRGGFNPGPLVATRMAGPEPVMRFETDYFSALEEVTSFAVHAGELELSAGDGASEGVLLRFGPAPPVR